MHIKERDIALFIENSLKSEKRRKIEQHLSVCGLCRRRLHQWEDLYNTFESLDYDFQLDGLEEKVISKINSMAAYTEPVKNELKFPVMFTVASFVLITLASIVFGPVHKIINGFAGNVASLILNAGVNLIQKIKWPLKNIISLIFADQTESIMSIISSAVLIIGGICFLISNMFNKKLRRV